MCELARLTVFWFRQRAAPGRGTRMSETWENPGALGRGCGRLKALEGRRKGKMANAEKVVELTPRSRRKHAGGRPRACTPRVQATILEIAATGAHRSVVAASAGISLRTLNRFLQLAETARHKKESGRRLTKDEEEFCQFCLDFHKSEAAMQIALVAVVRKAAETNWRAALTFLERRWPERWGRRRIVQIVTTDDESDL